MKISELVDALRKLKVQTGSLACRGCGHEHDCGIHGCAILREAHVLLAGYEETGLSPAGVENLQRVLRRYREREIEKKEEQ